MSLSFDIFSNPDPNISNWGQIEDWGLTHYPDAFDRQLLTLRQRILSQRPDTLIFTEHHPVITIGRRKNADSHILFPSHHLSSLGISIHHSNRGGDVTYHAPGQIIAYPILSLHHQKDLSLYLRNLEQVLINALGCLGLATSRRPGKTGIWLGHKKIAALGIAVKQWTTYHGFALNVNIDLSPFSFITPCGIHPSDGSVTSMALELGHPLSLPEVKSVLAIEFWKIFAKYPSL